MSNNRSTVLWVALGSAIFGSLGTLIFVDSSQPKENLTQLSGKSELGKPPKPEWQNASNRNDISSTQAPDSFSTQERRAPKYPKPTLENPPAAKQLREEVALDSHSTPQSLIEFAQQAAESIESAYTNADVRYNVSRQLVACARDAQSKGVAQAARAYCLSNLSRPKDKFPEELTPAYQALIAELPDDLLFVAGVNKTAEEK